VNERERINPEARTNQEGEEEKREVRTAENSARQIGTLDA
jgi:hypothetical protein